MADPLNQIVHHINEHLRRLDPDLSVEAEVTVPAVVTLGAFEHETEVRLRVTGDGTELVEAEEQVQRIEDEIRTRIESAKDNE